MKRFLSKGGNLSWLLAILIGGGLALFMNLQLLRVENDTFLKNAAAMIEVKENISKHYVEEIDDEKLFYGALDGIADQLDQYSSIIRPEDVKDFESMVEGEFGGLGIIVEMKDEQLTVITPIGGTPAFEAGVLAGDKIVEIDGKSTEGISLFQATRRLKGKPGTKVTITVKHTLKELQETEKITITRAKLKLESIKNVQVIDPESAIGYIRITQFQKPTAADFRKALTTLKEHRISALVLDLRFNAGGILDGAVSVADEFIEDGAIVSTHGRGTADVHYKASKGGQFTNAPVAVLVNGSSASASEIVAAALQQTRRAILIGERTFGKGSVQHPIYLNISDQRAVLKLTTAYYYTPGGHCVHKGVKCLHPQRYCFWRQNEAEFKRGGIRPNIEVSVPQKEAFDLYRFLSRCDIERLKGLDNNEQNREELLKRDICLRTAIKYLRHHRLYAEALEAPSAYRGGRD